MTRQHPRSFRLVETVTRSESMYFEDSLRTVERVQIKSSLWLTLPQPQVVGRLSSIPGNHHVVCDSQNFLTSCPLGTPSTIAQSLGVAIEANVISDIKTR